MTIAGIIAEYNPLHNGHALLIKQLKENGADSIAVVISGNFVQRGEAAILSKWARAQQALLCGADLVLELPLPWAVAGAERFSFGGVSLLTALGADIIGFGSECGNLKQLMQAEDALSSPLLHDAMRKSLTGGMTFAAARQQAVDSLFGTETAALLSEPNNILGIEYLKAISRLKSDLKPFTMKRFGSGHNSAETVGQTASSSKIRSMIIENNDCFSYMPLRAYQILQSEIEGKRAPASLVYVERAILAKLRLMNHNDFEQLPDVSEGLENRIAEAVRKAGSLDELYRLIKSKRYTLARIRRIILSAFLGINASHCIGLPPYLRVLGINKSGLEILKRSKNKSSLPILSRHADINKLNDSAKTIIQLENRASDLYSLCIPQVSPCGLDCTNKLTVL